jgi:hypothetical protein
MKTIRATNVSDMYEVLGLLDELKMTGEPLGLRVNGKVVAVLEPVEEGDARFDRRRPTEAQLEALRSAAGSWSDEDAEYVLNIINERRNRADQLP